MFVVYTVILCLFILLILYGKRLYVSVYIKRLIFPLACLAFLLCLVIFSKTAMESAAKGIDLWLNIVFPSLFPFFVASELLNGTGFIKAFGILLEPVMRPLFNVPGCGSFAYAMGITSGYPVGARITAGMRISGLLSKVEAERLLAFSNNSGPLFIVGAVATGMFKMPGVGIFMLACHIAACTTVGILFRFYGKKGKDLKGKSNDKLTQRFKKEFKACGKATNFGTLLGDAVKNSISMILAIGGFIILFSVIINLLIEAGIIGYLSAVLSALVSPLGGDSGIVSAVLSGFFEITTGTKMASASTYAGLVQKLTAASFIIGWAGLSVHSQVISVIKDTDISIKPYLLGKFIQGVLAGFYTLLGLSLFGDKIMGVSSVFLIPQGPVQQSFHTVLPISLAYLAASIIFLFLTAIISKFFSYLRINLLRSVNK